MEQERINDLHSYFILDKKEEIELNELAELASLICGAPISLITLIDENYQWFKAKIGLTLEGTKREDAFCVHTLEKKEELLVVNDAANDERFSNNPLVTGPEKIRFYAGAPIVSVKGNVLGTICVLDREPRSLNEKQQNGLRILAKKVHKFMYNKKLILEQQNDIEQNAEKLRKLTYSIPATIFQLRRKTDKSYRYDFLSIGEFKLPENTPEKEIKSNPDAGFELVFEDDREAFRRSLELSYKNLTIWEFEYRVVQNKDTKWYMVKATPEKQDNGDVVWYGCFNDITPHVKYEETIEQIAFDISHVMRKPIANLLGLASLIDYEKNISEKELKKYTKSILDVSQEMDSFTRELDKSYQDKKISNYKTSFKN